LLKRHSLRYLYGRTVRIQFLIADNRKYLAVRQLALVLLQNHLGNVQQGNIHVRVRLLTLGDYPKFPVKGFADILLPQVGDIAVSQTAETGKDEQVPDVFQTLGSHFLFEDDFYLVLCQIPPVHFHQPDFIIGERVFVQYAIVSGYDDDALEELHELGGRVVAAFTGSTQVQLKIGNEHRGYLLYGNIRKVVLALYELGEVAAGNFILAVGGYRLGYAHKLFHIVIVLLKQGKDCLVALVVSQELVLHFLGGNVIVTPLHFVVNGVQRCPYVVQQGVYPPGILAFGFACRHVPVLRLDALFSAELA